MELRVYYYKRGTHIVLDGIAMLSEDKQNQARQVVRMYPRILELQMDAPKQELRPSIRKLMAQGKVEIVKGRYRVKAKSGSGRKTGGG